MEVDYAFLTSIIAGVVLVIKILYSAANVETVFQKAVFQGKSATVKLAFQARVARVAILLAQYVKLDLVDGVPQEMDKLEQFLVNGIAAARNQNPINNLNLNP